MEYIITLFLRTIKKSVKDRNVYLIELSKLTCQCLTDIASSLYVYMLFLEKANRLEEAELLKEYRTTLFKHRDYFSNKLIDEQIENHIDNIALYLKSFTEKINIQTLMLRNSGDDRNWEHIIFQSINNDALLLMYKLNNDLNYDK